MTHTHGNGQAHGYRQGHRRRSVKTWQAGIFPKVCAAVRVSVMCVACPYGLPASPLSCFSSLAGLLLPSLVLQSPVSGKSPTPVHSVRLGITRGILSIITIHPLHTPGFLWGVSCSERGEKRGM